jgi:ABC-type polysaccharide/polyol phosphate export permease
VSATAAGHPETNPPIRRPTVVIEPTRGWAAIDFGELWKYRDLLMILAARDVKLRYKQTALGVAWVVIQPLVAALIFTVMFGRFAKLPAMDSRTSFLFLLRWRSGTISLRCFSARATV